MHKRKIVKSPAPEAVPEKLNLESLHSLINLLDRLHVCCGQPDSHFVSMVSAKKGKVHSSDGKVAASVDMFAFVTSMERAIKLQCGVGHANWSVSLRNVQHVSLIVIHCKQCTVFGVRGALMT